MEDPHAVGRRGFLKAGAVAAAAAAAGCGGPESRFRVLTEDEARTLAAACDQIVPPDEDPGAAEAGAVAFIDRQLSTRRRKPSAAGRRGSAGSTRPRAVATARPSPSSRSPARPRCCKTSREARSRRPTGAASSPPPSSPLLREHTMMGFYGDPRHGGNRDRVSWKMLGVSDPPIRGRLHEAPAPAPAPAARPAGEAESAEGVSHGPPPRQRGRRGLGRGGRRDRLRPRRGRP